MQLQSGTKLQNGKYVILRTLGQGGFGITYEANQIMMDRHVCIKEFFIKEYCDRDDASNNVSLGSTGNADMMQRYMAKFEKEAKTIAKLNHPNIIGIHDVFRENNTVYYVMEFLSGSSLNDRVKKAGTIPEDEALRYIRQIGAALAYAHSQRIMHLDVKPANIMIDGDRAVLIDFGLSKQYSESGDQTSSTPVGISHGYAPLEQYQDGGVKEFSPETDVYSLGATLYKTLTGVTPPPASDVAQTGLPSIPGTISSSVRIAIEKAMNFRRQERPHSIEEFMALIDAASVNSYQSENDERTYVKPHEADSKKEPTSKAVKNPSFKLSTKDTKSNDSKKKWIWVLVACVVAVLVASVFVLSGSGTKVSDPTGEIEGHGYVDLGLPSGLKWATCNLGASSPSKYGSLFAWGETAEKEQFFQKEYAFYVPVDDLASVTKYNPRDEDNCLNPEDDAARIQWGGSWRMPTTREIKELLDDNNCSWMPGKVGGKGGYIVTSKKNGNSIFFPAAGSSTGKGVVGDGAYGYYWSSNGNVVGAEILNFNMVQELTGAGSSVVSYFGCSIRPVSD